jgi:hypothetical protein
MYCVHTCKGRRRAHTTIRTRHHTARQIPGPIRAACTSVSLQPQPQDFTMTHRACWGVHGSPPVSNGQGRATGVEKPLGRIQRCAVEVVAEHLVAAGVGRYHRLQEHCESRRKHACTHVLGHRTRIAAPPPPGRTQPPTNPPTPRTAVLCRRIARGRRRPCHVEPRWLDCRHPCRADRPRLGANRRKDGREHQKNCHSRGEWPGGLRFPSLGGVSDSYRD